MDIRRAFALAFKQLRKSSGLTQEDFSVVSSRTYVSVLERGMKSPTLEKIDELASTMQIHPLTLLTLTYMQAGSEDEANRLFEIVRLQIAQSDPERKKNQTS
ncbi:XRE family transcriptional regulator [Novimethylophilus kurashikiensis]|uniref:XRE family transcriptional regulator n=1 Tax=Novimethylophilus kurashikiensis TaxID=1825523 RepID=A0A2R5F941_9PROT|nr:helix-turn-helix transcriptional regulator [Novimethylophilus kurashikiensis]GBG14762.1 XRE family transcriptional regulator [Novimethylophilus kurashikiensis]